MSDSRYRPKWGHWDKESTWFRRWENRRRRHETSQRLRLGLDAKRYRGTEGSNTW